ncbi:type II secretion system F family protein [Cupriavidus sp. BIC8F]|nr:type II secretion system F family protein [Cupriavidus sp. BIC8F]
MAFQSLIDEIKYRAAVRAFRKTREKFYDSLAESIADGEAMARYFSALAARAAAQKDPLAVLYKQWLRRMDMPGAEGGRLSHVLKGCAPEMDLMIISAQDLTLHRLPETLRFLATTIKSQRKLNSVLVKAVTMPAVALVITVVFMVVLSLLVVPVFSLIAPPEKWGAAGYSLYLISYAVTHYGILIAGVVAAGVWAYVWSIRNWTGPYRVKADRMVFYRVFRDYYAAQFLVAVASMLAAGVGLDTTLEELKKRSSPWLRWHITKISKNRLRASRSHGEAFNTGVLAQPIANRLIDSSRRSSDFPAVMKRIGIEGMDETRQQVEESAFKLNLTMVLIMGVVVGYLILGTMRTGQDLSSAMKGQLNHQQYRR